MKTTNNKTKVILFSILFSIPIIASYVYKNAHEENIDAKVFFYEKLITNEKYISVKAYPFAFLNQDAKSIPLLKSLYKDRYYALNSSNFTEIVKMDVNEKIMNKISIANENEIVVYFKTNDDRDEFNSYVNRVNKIKKIIK